MAGVVAGCGGMWQGFGYLEWGQAYDMDGVGWGHVVGCGACGRVWGHVAGVVAGCRGMW